MTKMRIFFEIHGPIKLYSVSYDQLKKSCQSKYIYAIHKFSLWVKWTYKFYLGAGWSLDTRYWMLDTGHLSLVTGFWLLVTGCLL